MVLTCGNALPCRVKLCSGTMSFLCRLATRFTWHFFTEIDNCQTLAHLLSLWRFCWNIAGEQEHVRFVYSFRSSAYSFGVIQGSNTLTRSLMYIMNNRGPRQLPWITPLVTRTDCEKHWPTLVHWVRSCNKFMIRESKSPLIQQACNLIRSFSWETVSNARAKST